MIGLASFTTGFIQRNDELRAQRLQNMRAWEEFRRNNPTATLEEMSSYADQLSGGDNWVRGQLPSQAVLQTMAEENGRRRAQEQVLRTAQMAEAEERLSATIGNAYGRRLLENPDDPLGAAEEIAARFGGDDPNARARVSQAIRSLGSPDAVIQRMTSTAVAQHGAAAQAAFALGGEDAVRRQFSTLGPQAVDALIGLAKRDQEQRDFERNLRLRGANNDDRRIGLAESEAAGRNREEVFRLTRESPIIAAALAEGDEASRARATEEVRRIYGSRGLTPTDGDIEAALGAGQEMVGLQMRERHRQVRQQAAQSVSTPEFRRQFDDAYEAPIRGLAEGLNSGPRGAVRSLVESLYLSPRQVEVAIEVARSVGGNDPRKIIDEITKHEAFRSNPPPTRAEAFRRAQEEAINARTGFVPMTSAGYRNMAVSANEGALRDIDRGIAEFLRRAPTLSEAGRQGTFNAITSRIEARIEQEKRELQRRLESQHLWATTPLTQDHIDAINNSIRALETRLGEIRAAGIPNATAPAPAAAQGQPARPAPQPDSAGRSAPSTRLPVVRQGAPVSPEEDALTQRYNRGEVSEMDYQRQMRELRSRQQAPTPRPQSSAPSMSNPLASLDPNVRLVSTASRLSAALSQFQDPVARVRYANQLKAQFADQPEMVMAINDAVQQLNGVRGGSTSRTARNAAMPGWDDGIPAPGRGPLART